LIFLDKPREASLLEVTEFIEYADLNKDNKIDKEEMLIVFKKAINDFHPKH
jgi:hypothetical protein